MSLQVHKANWRLLASAAQNYMNIPHQGFIVAGKFCRGNQRGGGKVVNAVERDRVRALQLMAQAMPQALKDENHAEVGDYLLALANMLLNNRGYSESWRLQYLTDLKVLPDYEDGWGYYRQTIRRAGGCRRQAGVLWRAQEFRGRGKRRPAVAVVSPAGGGDESRSGSIRCGCSLPSSLLNQFGVQTMAQWGWRFGRMETDDTKEDESGTYALHTLKENETIARLASGIKRFTLPDEFNYIKIFQEVAAKPQAAEAVEALEHLAQIFENRRQYTKAADYWQRLLTDFPSQDRNRRQGWQQRLDQIVGNWGRFEPARPSPPAAGPPSSTASATDGRSTLRPTRSTSRSCWTT